MNTFNNRVQLIGSVQCHPETILLPNGNLFSKFLIRVEEPPDQQMELSGDISLHNLIAWDQTAEIAEALLKIGQRIAIEGRLLSIKDRDYAGLEISRTEIEVKDMIVLCDQASGMSRENKLYIDGPH